MTASNLVVDLALFSFAAAPGKRKTTAAASATAPADQTDDARPQKCVFRCCVWLLCCCMLIDRFTVKRGRFPPLLIKPTKVQLFAMKVKRLYTLS